MPQQVTKVLNELLAVLADGEDATSPAGANMEERFVMWADCQVDGFREPECYRGDAHDLGSPWGLTVCEPPLSKNLLPSAPNLKPSTQAVKAESSSHGAVGIGVKTEAALNALESVDTIVRRLKDEERRMRNRESASRSNARKKTLRLLLQQDLRAERARVCELMMRAKVLREENGRLRAMALGTGASGS